jgi:hypothetical protein
MEEEKRSDLCNVTQEYCKNFNKVQIIRTIEELSQYSDIDSYLYENISCLYAADRFIQDIIKIMKLIKTK